MGGSEVEVKIRAKRETGKKITSLVPLGGGNFFSKRSDCKALHGSIAEWDERGKGS